MPIIEKFRISRYRPYRVRGMFDDIHTNLKFKIFLLYLAVENCSVIKCRCTLHDGIEKIGHYSNTILEK